MSSLADCVLGSTVDSQKTAPLFDAHYYATGCGRPYQRDEEWLRFFNSIADHIVSNIHPSTVLDAGCAMGFLVEALRQRGVEAFGVDVSEYAIHHVHPSVQPYCCVGSITDSDPRKYDLIVSIEVLEHLYPDQAEPAVSNLCSHTDDILFSSTPLDTTEKTHFNVQPPEYWAELFRRCDFYHDADFDASFITPWAARFRRGHGPLSQAIAAYERRLWRLEQENQARRIEVEALYTQLRGWEARRATLESSVGWAILRRLQNWRARLAPPGSKRDHLIEVAFHQLTARR